MEKILFHKVIPDVFSEGGELSSELWDQNVVFEKGHLYLLEANSGKGKSTFCSYLVGYRHDYVGQIMFDQQDIRSININNWVDIRKQHLSYLPQDLRLFPELTALENVLIKNNITHFKTQTDIYHWFEELDIADKLHVKLSRMSFGQQQRVALMRSLVQPFEFLLADEPVSHLDDENGKVMGELMMREARCQGAGVIVTSIGKHIDLNYDTIIKL